jgi:hypothetical protein
LQEYYHSHNASKLNALAGSWQRVTNFDVSAWLRLSKLRLDLLMAHFPHIRTQFRVLRQSDLDDVFYRVADPHHFYADPHPAFHYSADRIQLFTTLIRIRI